ncbi:MAG TPA: bile acid:sodium symporter family protein [Candidatus Acidoferrum sp.]|nr:bile acid:sodium symporter family protein [Candidatus Acidoferrum sp.]
MFKNFLPDPFMLALLSTLALATLLPASGDAAVVVNWLSTLTVVLLFFFHGAKLERSAVVAGLTHWRLHILILGCTFVAFPLLSLVLSHGLSGMLSPVLWTGMLYLAALPSTVQSSIAFVSIAKGNVPAAIASASASQVAGVVLTPIIVGLMSGARGSGLGLSGIGSVAMQILVPFVAGHLLRPWIGGFVIRHKSTISITDRATILIAVYGAFSSAVLEGIWKRLPPLELATLFGLCCLLLALALGFTAMLGKLLKFGRDDRIVIVFCGTKKSLVQGVPMARVLFAGPDLGLILLPIMIFHQVQLMVCAWIARRYARGVETDE